ncbi:ORF54 [callitrichine gammaherpesvirus 3]|uniref:ribonucleoside-diphosphate reductase n=1 Tax=callitrichine gammaherpesvirus 3 TaxID=106331 RepID=Q993F5_9GAMA|nr:ORF54 [callitrichine gammaherpesvirus 3]AAK38263.1 ORF54 [callitrichine gammaherpesvirus 3]
MSKFLYTRDHEGFARLTEETHRNRWVAVHISLVRDCEGVRELNPRDLEFYKFLFTFLAMAEKLVNFNIDELLPQFCSHDIEHYYTEQKAMENIHGETYANILNMLFDGDKKAVAQYADEVIADKALQAKICWLNGMVNSAVTKAEKILIFLLIEGIFFISSFYSIAVLRTRGIMPGICLANNYISRDELLHTTAATLLYNSMTSKSERPQSEWIEALFRRAVDVEYNFIEARGRGVTNIDLKGIRDFLEATADRILGDLGMTAIYDTRPPPDCPLTYMTSVKHTNFFEQENSEYTMVVTNDL